MNRQNTFQKIEIKTFDTLKNQFTKKLKDTDQTITLF